MYCKVVYDVPLDRDFDYAVPAEVYVDGTDEAGAIGVYQITVRIQS